MSQPNKQARHAPHCKKPESVTQECPIVVTASSLNVPSKKRKEDAEPILYLKRV